jgi:Stress responsive A/B Barrel Domain
MSEQISLFRFDAGAGEAERAAISAALAKAAQGAARGPVLAAATLPGGRNAGDRLLRISLPPGSVGVNLADRLPRSLSTLIAAEDTAVYEPLCSGGGVGPRVGVFRTALFHAFRRPTPARLQAFEAELAAMPRRVGSIRAWTLGRVIASRGRFAWTHAWEQTYDDLHGLLGPYMQHPCHWGQVDRWFDPEHPDWLIEPEVCHAFCQSDALPEDLKG